MHTLVGWREFAFACIIAALVCVALMHASDAGAATETVLYSFCSQKNCRDGGPWPDTRLIDIRGTLYGTTAGGGAHGAGTVFSVDANNGAETVLYSFCKHYRNQTCEDVEGPGDGLVEVGGTLVGATGAGGAYGQKVYGGTVFSFSAKTGREKVLYSFCRQQHDYVCGDGESPNGGLIDIGGRLYGATYVGGAADYGTVFSFDSNTGKEKVLYSFCGQYGCTDGGYPYGGVIDVKGMLYGTTSLGGTCYGCGTIFSVEVNTGREKVLHSFCGKKHCTDGNYPVAGLIDVKGTLYGTTEGGGSGCSWLRNGGCGTVFSFDVKTGKEKVLHSFCGHSGCADGAFPTAGLIDVGGTLYGTTSGGGTNTSCSGGCGTVFSLDAKSGAEMVLYSFCGENNCTDGAIPYAGLIAKDGTLYGTTSGGGANMGCSIGCGTVFSIKPLSAKWDTGDWDTGDSSSDH